MAVVEIEEKEVDQEVEIEEEIEIEMLTEGKADASIARERVIRLLIAKKAETEMVVAEVETPDQAVTHPKRDTTEEADPQEDTTTEEEETEEEAEEIQDQEVILETTIEETIAETNLDHEVHLMIAKTTITKEMADVKREVDLDLDPEAKKATDKTVMAAEITPEIHDQVLLLITMINQVVSEKLDHKVQNPIMAPKTLTAATVRLSQEAREAEVPQVKRLET